MIEHLDIAEVKPFELALLDRVRTTDADVLKEIATSQKFTPDSEKKVRAHIDALLVNRK